MGVRWDGRRVAPASRALRPATEGPPFGWPLRAGRTFGRVLPCTVYRQYLDGLARIHAKGKNT